jgi:hypothetical protein
MPVVSVRDISVRDGDLAIATHGRAFWVLDDVEPLRELAGDASPGARLFAPRDATRTRPGNDEAEASPPETPAGDNPPNGAYIDYLVPAGAQRAGLQILDAEGTVVRRWSSNDPFVAPDPADFEFPAFWLPTAPRFAATPGMHRFVWDFRVSNPHGPLAPPGRYKVRLNVAGHSYFRTLSLRRDPRVAASDADLWAQYLLAQKITALQTRVQAAIASAAQRRTSLSEGDRQRLDTVLGVPPQADPANSLGPAETGQLTLRYCNRLLRELFDQVDSADARPTRADDEHWAALQQKTLQTLAALAAL